MRSNLHNYDRFALPKKQSSKTTIKCEPPEDKCPTPINLNNLSPVPKPITIEEVSQRVLTTEEIEAEAVRQRVLTAVQNDGLILRRVRNKTPEICLAAVQQNGIALRYVENKTLEICLAAIKQTSEAIKYLKDILPIPSLEEYDFLSQRYYNYTDINVNNLSCSEVDYSLSNIKRVKSGSASIKYTSASNEKLVIKFPSIHLSTGGIPKKDFKFYTNEKTRTHIRIPLDESITESNKLIELLKKIDKVYSSESIRRILFKENWGETEYHPLYDDSDENKIRTLRLKLNIDSYDFPNKDLFDIKTKLFKIENDNGKKEHFIMPMYNNLDKFAKVVTIGSTIKPNVILDKIWVIDSTLIHYGISLIIDKIDVEVDMNKFKKMINAEDDSDEDDSDEDDSEDD